MLGRTYENQNCSIARTLEVVGERWTLLIIRDALLGLCRFEEFSESLGIPRNILTARLKHLVDHGLLERVRYQDRPQRYEYRLTSDGRELGAAIIALMHWGDRHHAGPAGPPRVAEHLGCGGATITQLTCTQCGQAVEPEAVEMRPGPGIGRRAPMIPAPAYRCDCGSPAGTARWSSE
jgi:DNA-binding HxlR family transcriptional regulator